jgi:NAD(P)-dependent dehydrogenase (short-subunit alcohol dehydrogenase family)
VLVNNAMSIGAFDPTMEVGLKGGLYMTRAAWPAFRAQGAGRIVNITSSVGLLGFIGPPQVVSARYGAGQELPPSMLAAESLFDLGYCAAKAAMFGVTRQLALLGARYRISANAVAPLGTSRANVDIPATGPWMADKCDPTLVAPVVAWLAHETCGCTGETFSVAGGAVSRVFLAHTPGIVSASLTPELVEASYGAIGDEHDYQVFASAQEEVEHFKQLLA